VSNLEVTWFFLVGILLTAYAVLDGFDLGVGFWYLFTRSDAHRRVLRTAIGPVWDGNEVWLLTGGGALFAAFPHAYATVFSGFYMALMLVLAALILRAASLEFRKEMDSPGWRRVWDWAFGLGSTLPALLFGVALGNILRGVPLDADKQFTGTFFTLLNPYALLIGVAGLLMLLTQGALFIALKTEGSLSAQGRQWAKATGPGYVLLLLVAMAATRLLEPQLLTNYADAPVLWVLPVLAVTLGAAALVLNLRRQESRAFVAWSACIVATMAMAGTGLFPNIVPALDNPALSLTADNASSGPLTLAVMLVIAAVGMPFVLGYTVWIYRVFAGKVTVGAADHY